MQDGKGRRRSAIAGLVVGVLASAGCPDSGPPGGAEDESTTGSIGSPSTGSSGDGEPGLPVPLVRAEGWDLDAAADDPFADHRPAFVQCEIGWDVETGLFEVNTELCLYGAFVQASLAPIQAGDELELVLLHDALYSDDEQETVAHVAVALGSEIAWETELPIPSEAAQVRSTWTATADLEVGSPIHLHVHNHGTNNYRLVALTVAER